MTVASEKWHSYYHSSMHASPKLRDIYSKLEPLIKIYAITPEGQEALIQMIKTDAKLGKIDDENISAIFQLNSFVEMPTQEWKNALFEIAKRFYDRNPLKLFSKSIKDGLDDVALKQLIVLFISGSSNALEELEQELLQQEELEQELLQQEELEQELLQQEELEQPFRLELLQKDEDDSLPTKKMFIDMLPPYAESLLWPGSIPPLKALEDAITQNRPALQSFLSHTSRICVDLERKGRQKTEHDLVRFAGLIFLRACVLEDRGQELGHMGTLLEQVLEVQDPALRYLLAIKILNDFSAVKRYQDNQNTSTFPDYAQLSMFLLSHFPLNDQEMKECLAVLNQRSEKFKGGRGTPALKDGHFQKNILKGLFTLLEDPQLVSFNKSTFLRGLLLYKDKDPNGNEQIAHKDEIKNAFRNLTGLIEMGEQKKIQAWLSINKKIPDLNPYEFLKNQYQEAFEALLPSITKEYPTSKIMNFLEGFRDPFLIIRYATKLKTLPEKSNSKILLNILAQELIEQIKIADKPLETKLRSRYEHDNVHFSHVFKQPGLKEKWMTPIKLPVSELLSLSSPSLTDQAQTLNFSNLIRSSFGHKHANLNEFPKLSAYFDQKMGLEVKTKEESHLEIDSQEKQQMRVFQDALIELCETCSVKSLEKALKCCPEEIKKSSPQFLADLHAWKQSAKESTLSLQESLTAMEGDDFYDFMASGSEVPGSCQNVDGNVEYNKCLLAYVSDGKNRLLALKNDQGVIKARAILRLLIDQTTKQPVLFMEQIYPTILNPKLKEALVALAKLKARDLKLTLLISQEEENSEQTAYPYAIMSLYSRAPYEYVDAEKLGITKGHFKISKAVQIQ